ncbi:uncharacterized protein [Malus domestica]|uniref:uncharacterized protein n=1 Tax=Malus domestica TaxID=3750 RepID=UPI0039768110
MAEDNSFEAESSLATAASSDVEVNPNQRLSSVLLNEFNYLPWARAISLALEGRSKLGYINGAIQAPAATYSESSMHLWAQVKEMYGNQNNDARVFQLKKDIANLQQEGKSFVQHLGSLTSMWNELDVYRPHTTDATVLIKRAEEDKIFQLLASLGTEFEDLRSHVLMNSELPSFTSVCAIIQREKVRNKVMNLEIKSNMPETRAYVSNHSRTE